MADLAVALDRASDIARGLPATTRGQLPARETARLPCDLPSVDALLGGGWPRGCLSELTAPPSSGRTTLLLALLAAALRRGETVACLDLTGSLAPETLTATGTELSRFLWVHPPTLAAALRGTELLLQAGGFGVVALDLGNDRIGTLPAHAWPRLARAAEASRSALVIATATPTTGSFSSLRVELTQAKACWSPGPRPLFEGFQSVATVARCRQGRPGQTARLQFPQGPTRHLPAPEELREPGAPR